MKKRMLWYAALVLMCCSIGAVIAFAATTDKPVTAKKQITNTGVTYTTPAVQAKHKDGPSATNLNPTPITVNRAAPGQITARRTDGNPELAAKMEIEEIVSQIMAAKNAGLEPAANLYARYNELMGNTGRNGRSLDQGNDVCPASPTGAVPYTDSGTTVGMVNDYTTCGASSPDVIYTFTPTVTGTYYVSLCGSSYDTMLEVRTDGACPGTTQVGCNDDYCGLQSQLTVAMTASVEYFIIVEGYSTNAGAYVLNITQAPEVGDGVDCTDPALITDAVALTGETTCGYLDDYFGTTCLGAYDGGEDKIYQWTVSVDGWYKIIIDPLGTAWTGIAVDDACPLDATCLGSSTSSGTAAHWITCTFYPAGVYYIMVDTWPSPDCIPLYNLTIEPCEPCVPPANDDCANAGPASPVPVTFTGDNTCATHDCSQLTVGEGETWHMITTTEVCNLVVDYCGTGGTFGDYYIVLVPDCPCTSYIVASTWTWTCPDGSLEIFYYNLPVGTYYIPVLREDAAGAFGPYTLNVYCQPPCIVECPTGGIPEGEDCPTDINGGCNSTPNVFSTIECGQTVCGTGWFDGSTRDTDWYQFTVASPTLATITLQAEFAVVGGFIEFLCGYDGTDGCGFITGSINPFISGNPCTILTASMTVPAGTWWIFVGPQFAATFECADYYLTLDCAPAELPLGACCYGPDVFNPLCQNTTEWVCCDLGGRWYVGEDCATFTCPTPPANDPCSGAELVGIPSSTFGSTTLANPDPEAITCVTSYDGGPAVWYKVIGTGTSITASTCNAITTYDTKLHIYCGSCSDFVCVNGNDDNCVEFGLRSLVTWCAQSGVEYYVLVSGFAGQVGDFQLDISEDGIPCEPTVVCSCPDVENVTAYMIPGNGVDVRFTAPASGVYTIWKTENKNNDGDPNGGTDTDFASVATLNVIGAGVQTWIDTDLSVNYKNYVVTSSCGPVGRCCYGPDPSAPLCAEVPAIVCAGLGGDWTEGLTCADPCPTPVICPPGASQENEPICADEYVDITNGGCNSPPDYPFGTIACGETMCGTSGTYLFGGGNYRDTDWFQITTTSDYIITWSVQAEFPLLIFIISGTCDAYTILGSATANPNETAILSSACLPAGTYMLWVGPSVFVDVPCGATWVGTATCEPCTPPEPAPDNCGEIGTLTEPLPITAVGTTVGLLNDYAGTCIGGSAPDAIYQYTPTASGGYTVSLCGSSFDTGLYVNTGGACPGTTELACNDDFCGVQSQVSVTLTAGETYYIVVDAYSTAAGDFILTITNP